MVMHLEHCLASNSVVFDQKLRFGEFDMVSTAKACLSEDLE